jgi:tripartite-type tricarboxylate transporter receptor subunit TctC
MAYSNRAVAMAALSLAAISLASTQPAFGQAFPSKPIRVINPFGVGSATDVIPRIILEQMQVNLGQPVLLEARPGAGSATGTAQVVAAEPDGYTLLVNSSAHTLVPAMYKHTSFDTARDLTGVAMLGIMPQVLITSPANGLKTVGAFVAAAQARPGTFNFATTGVGAATHVSAEKFRLSAKFEATHVPFKSGAEALTEIVAGRMDFYLCPIGTALPFIQEGRVLGLVVSTPKRAVALPGVPTTLEAGYPNSDYTFWFALFAPAKTPKAIVERLHLEAMKALEAPNVKARLAQNGVEPLAMTPAQLDALVIDEIKANMDLIKLLGLKPS